MVKIKRAPVAGLHLLEGEIVKKDLKISGMSFKNVPVIPEVKNDDTSYHVSEPVYKRLYTLLQSSPNLCVNYFFSRALVVQGMPLHPCLCTSTLEGAVKGAPLRTSKRFP